jgi:hypothetical protein
MEKPFGFLHFHLIFPFSFYHRDFFILKEKKLKKEKEKTRMTLNRLGGFY